METLIAILRELATIAGNPAVHDLIDQFEAGYRAEAAAPAPKEAKA